MNTICKCSPEIKGATCKKCQDKDKHPGGRPALFSDPIELQAKCDSYFEEVDQKSTGEDNYPYLITGLALHLGMDTDTLSEYEKRDKFIGIVKRAKAKVSLDLQERSIMDPRAAVGCLFNLKCNHGMVEMKHIEISGNKANPLIPRQININIVKPEDKK